MLGRGTDKPFAGVGTVAGGYLDLRPGGLETAECQLQGRYRRQNLEAIAPQLAGQP